MGVDWPDGGVLKMNAGLWPLESDTSVELEVFFSGLFGPSLLVGVAGTFFNADRKLLLLP